MTERMLTRRTVIAAGFASMAAPALAAPFAYDLKPVRIGMDSWAVYGAAEDIKVANGGAIGNAAFVRTGAGTVIVDCGPSLRFGNALKGIAEATTGEPVVRVYLTHLHPDHVLGAGAFDPAIVAATPAAVAEITRDAPGFTDAMYRLLGDWMRGTASNPPGIALTVDAEVFGRHRFRLLPLEGHSAADLAVLDETSGILFAGDLVFADRAPSTPHADTGKWLAALTTLAALPHRSLLPGHGPLDLGQQSIDQTRDWLVWLDKTMRGAVGSGLDMAEAGSLPIPARFAGLAMARYELERSATHFYPRLEAGLLPRVDRLSA